MRSARQQDFLRQIKNQIGAGGLISRRFAIEKIFGKYASTDIRSGDDVLKLLELVVQSASHPVRQVTFNATVGPSYVTANGAQLRLIREAFLNGGSVPGRIQVNTQGKRAAQPFGERPAHAGVVRRPRTGTGRGAEADVPAPTTRSVGSAARSLRRTCCVRTCSTVTLRMSSLSRQGGLGQYYDLEGTTWQTPPILNNPSQTIRLGGRTVQLYFEGRRLRVVAWHAGGPCTGSSTPCRTSSPTSRCSRSRRPHDPSARAARAACETLRRRGQRTDDRNGLDVSALADRRDRGHCVRAGGGAARRGVVLALRRPAHRRQPSREHLFAALVSRRRWLPNRERRARCPASIRTAAVAAVRRAARGGRECRSRARGRVHV